MIDEIPCFLLLCLASCLFFFVEGWCSAGWYDFEARELTVAGLIATCLDRGESF